MARTNSYLIPISQRNPRSKLTGYHGIDHKKRPHHDRFGRPLAPWKPEDDEPVRDSKGKPLCYARLPNGAPGTYGDNRCHQSPMANGRCRRHGGKSLVGSSHPRFKHGKYSRSLPDRLQAAYLDSLNDENKLALDNELAAVDARLIELMNALDHEGDTAAWARANELMDEMYTAAQKGQNQLATQKMMELRDVLKSGGHNHAIWEAILRTMERRRKLSETEQKRIVLARETMTAQQAQLFAARVIQIVRDSVKDPEILSKISYGLIQLSGPASGDRIEPGD